MSELTWTPGLHDTFNTQIKPEYVEDLDRFNGRNELIFALGALKGLRKVFGGGPVKKGIVVGAAGAVLVSALQTSGGEVSADLNKANTVVDIDLIEFKTDTKIESATASFQEKFTAEEIEINFDNNAAFGLLDTAPDCPVHKELNGIGTIEFKLPLAALDTQLGKEGKTNILVDASKLQVKSFWEGAGPMIKDFEKDGNKRDYGDTGNWCTDYNALNGALGNLTNTDKGTAKLLEEIHDNIENDMKLKGLRLMTETCTPKLDAPNKAAIRKAITNTVIALGDADKLGEVQFTTDTFKWNEIKIPAPRSGKAGDMGATYTLNKSGKPEGFTVDKITCNVPPEIVAQGAGS